MNTTSRSTRLLAAALLVAALPFGLAACSSDDTAPDGPRTSQGIGAKWSACMREGGFDVADAPDDEVRSGVVRSPEGVDTEAWNARAGTCSGQLGIEGTSEQQAQQWEREYAAVASCIRENGYADFPEQEPGVLNTGDYARAEEPHFDEVFQRCLHEHAPSTRTAGR